MIDRIQTSFHIHGREGVSRAERDPRCLLEVSVRRSALDRQIFIEIVNQNIPFVDFDFPLVLITRFDDDLIVIVSEIHCLTPP